MFWAPITILSGTHSITDLSQWVFAVDVPDDAVFNMTRMFDGAVSFNQSLCAWQDEIPTENGVAVMTDMFLNAPSCPSMEDPMLLNAADGDEWAGPFCSVC